MDELIPKQILESIFRNSEYRQRDIEIVTRRLQGDKSDTLVCLTLEYGLTRNRILQIEKRGRRALHNKLSMLYETWQQIPDLIQQIEDLEAEVKCLRETGKPLSEIQRTEAVIIPINRYADDIPVWVWNSLRNGGFSNWNQVAKATDGELLKMKCFGTKALAIIKQKLIELGFRKP